MAKARIENGYVRVANELIDRLVLTDLNGREMRVFLAVLRETYGWRTSKRAMTLKRIGEMTGLDRRHVPRVLRGLISRNMIRRNGVTGVESDTALWTEVTPNWGAPNSGAPKTVSGVTSKMVSKVTSKMVSPLLIKDKKDKSKDIPYGSGSKTQTPQQAFVESWKAVYEASTQQPFVTTKDDFINATRLIGSYGLEACQQKAAALARLCSDGERFPARSGWADFTIRNLVRNWNSIIQQERMSDQEIKDKKFMKKLEEERNRDERISQIINTAR